MSKSDANIAVPANVAGYRLLADARLNKGTAFTEQERDLFGLHGLLPPQVATIDEQVTRRLEAFRIQGLGGKYHLELVRYTGNRLNLTVPHGH